MARIIDGKLIAAQLRKDCLSRSEKLLADGIRPKLDVIIVGNDPASHQYVNSRAADCAAVGLASTVHSLNEDTKQSELIELIETLNADDNVHGILLQMPLPKHMNPDEVISHISMQKDVDGFHPMNVGALVSGKPAFAPCTPSSIMQLIRSTGIDISGKNAVVVGRSNVVGRPAAMLLLKESATVTICHSRTIDLKEHTLNADILVAAVGVPNLITGDMIKPGAIVIDAGINRVDGKTVGDVEFETAKDVAGFISPVPGGVGPVTRTILLMNTLEACERLNGRK
ncbi:MAG: bifunctional 5,10-methylenetetrahydrofolate dehydrogenase/5,10-methenyltetrahydrofolate cyclohydrolase [Clostridium sp.]|nr:bifunctional 5,10-methylenetetrahydrofolate dehydrogenase/5,10-methenyltetrahydrofolate cyclohydrolase [Clostridium sp.]MDY2925804.1 bifunctional 5,10-methylenetetrahydrofolate dehydrogenase/5,10-methenyltetrahydrofolate cyclohydrolase [Eubacteriales bacterium]MCI6818268.1 bifunctional 5,10-methylenetetrahydrofolate dehydrogenase/5,10-methenyltetrahydrofolate cyclohydrolase [Clostridium sp.]MCI6986719.1 bifunctional 5,10-methylenetetrahydrofolate dehydrogenase/5,10-methenyltetrahydrofolate cy